MPPRAAGTHLRSPTNPAGLTSRAISKASRPAATAPCEAARAGFARGEEACRATSRRRTTTRRRADTTRDRATDEQPRLRPAGLRAGDRPAAKLRVGIGCRADGPLRAAARRRARVRFGAAGRPRLRSLAHRGFRAAEFAARPGSTGHPEPAGRTRHVRLSPVGSPAPAGLRSAGPAELRSAEHVQLRPAARDRIRAADPAGAAGRARVRPAGCRRLRRGGDRGLPSVRRGRSNPFRLVRRWRPAGLR